MSATTLQAFGDKPAVMRHMFDSVAPRYDLVNRVLSAGSDRRWRRAVAEEVLKDNPQIILDACSGTADQALALLDKGFCGKIVCADISLQMLGLGKEKASRKQGVEFVLSDIHKMSMCHDAFDAATVCFGVRNFENTVNGLRELARVLKPGAKLVILEFSRPTRPLLWNLYRWYLTKILPRIGGALSGQGRAYRYLASSIDGFLTPAQLAGKLQESGFGLVQHRRLSGGIVAITTAHKKEG